MSDIVDNILDPATMALEPAATPSSPILARVWPPQDFLLAQVTKIDSEGKGHLTATRLRRFTPADRVPGERARWQQLRQAVRRRFALRAQGRQFRRNPDAYLKQLEENCLKLALPT